MPDFIRRYRIHHLPAWIGLFAGWYYFRFQDYPAHKAGLITFIKTADLAIMVYATNGWLIPRFLYKKKYLLFAAAFVTLVFSFSLLKMYVEGGIMHRSDLTDVWDNFKVRFYDNVIPHFLLVSTGAAFKLLMDYARAQQRLAEISKEKAETELNFLRSQINPHLLFNSLNAIYFLIDRQNVEARQSLLQFSDLLRYQLYDCNSDTVAIEKELTYLQDYLTLQRLRRDHQYEIQMNTGGSVRDFHITPLLLILFVENAFKHLSHHSDRRNFVQVDLQRDPGSFHFTVENSKEARPSSAALAGPGGGIGLQNVKRRLLLLYPGKHELKIYDNDATFKISLNLQIP